MSRCVCLPTKIDGLGGGTGRIEGLASRRDEEPTEKLGSSDARA
jgi:hypothetical protein